MAVIPDPLVGVKSLFEEDGNLDKDSRKYKDVLRLFNYRVDADRILKKVPMFGAKPIESLIYDKKLMKTVDDHIDWAIAATLNPLCMMSIDGKSIDELSLDVHDIKGYYKIQPDELTANDLQIMGKRISDSVDGGTKKPEEYNLHRAALFLIALGNCYDTFFDLFVNKNTALSDRTINLYQNADIFVYGLKPLLKREYTPNVMRRLFKATDNVLDNYMLFRELKGQENEDAKREELKVKLYDSIK